MATAYKCDRCKKYFNEFNKRLIYFSNEYDKQTYDICKECSQAFEIFVKEGMINEK